MNEFENKILIYISNPISERLRYTFDFIFSNNFGITYLLTQSETEFEQSNLFKINYSHKNLQAHLTIVSVGLLYETEIVEKEITVSNWNKLPIFFQTNETEIPFDIFSAIFYLISRYEEYLPYEPDLYKRFPHTQSLAFQHDFLQIPLIDLWIEEMKNIIKNKKSSIVFKQKEFQFLPTYDIDIAYSYKGKGLQRNIGGALKDLIKGNFKAIKNRVEVLLNKAIDPYDSFNMLNDLHRNYSLKPIYFFLLSEGSEFDKNLDRNSELMKNLIQNTTSKYEIGIHPSWKSHENFDILHTEKNHIEYVTKSRQHYIRFTMPDTFRNLLKLNIYDDYSMGYGSINGFRASTSNSFKWFDVEKNEVSNVTLHPFCYMECNSFYEQGFSATEALNELLNYLQIIKKVNGTMITIFHNFSLGTDELWKGWKEKYIEFIEKI